MRRALLSLLVALCLVACGGPPVEEARPAVSPSPGEAAASAEPLAALIDAYLEEKGSPLAGLGAEFVASGRRHDVDPRLVVAIAGAETSFGTRLGCYDSSGNVVANPYNAWNWFYKGGCPSPFGSWGDGIDRVTAGLRRLYLDQGLESTEAIGPKYSPAEPETWIRNVTSFYQALGGDPQDLTFKAGEEVVRATPSAPESSQGLRVPFISQWEERHGQCKGWGNCGPASAAMAFEYFGRRPEGLSDAEFVHWMRLQMTGQEDSHANRYTDIADIQAACEKDEIGLACRDVGSVEEIRAAVKAGEVVICAVNAQLLEPPQYAQRFVSGEMRHHILMVRGFGEREGEQVVWVNDPLSNPQTLREGSDACPADGGPGYYTYASWSAALEAERYKGKLQAVAITDDTGGVPILAPGGQPAPEVGITVVPATVAVPTAPPSLLAGESTPIDSDAVPSVVQAGHLGRGRISDATYCTEGRFFAVASPTGVYIYDTHSLTENGFLASETIGDPIAFSSDGAILVTRNAKDGMLRLWTLPDGSPVATLQGRPGRVWSMDISSDGQYLAAGSDDGMIRIWRVADGALLHAIQGHVAAVSDVQFSPDGHTLASGSWDGRIRLWRVDDGALLHTLSEHAGAIYSLDFSPAGAILVSGSSDSISRIWRVADGTLLRTLHQGGNEFGGFEVFEVAFSPNSQTIVTRSQPGVKIWRVDDGSLICTIDDRGFTVYSVAYSPDGASLATYRFGSSNGSQVQLWEAISGALLGTWEVGCQNGLRFSPDGETLACVSFSSVRFLSSGSDSADHQLQGFSETIWGLEFSPDGKLLALSTAGSVQLWQVSSRSLMRVINADTGSVSNPTFSPNGAFLATSVVNTIELRRVSDGTLLWTTEGSPQTHSERVTALAFSPDGQTIASASEDKTIRIWRVSDGLRVSRLEVGSATSTLKFSQDGHLLVAGSDAGLEIWNLANGRLLRRLSDEGPTRIVFFPQGDAFVTSAPLSHVLSVWRVADRSLSHTLHLQNCSIDGFSISPDGTIIATGCRDGTIKLWDASTGTLIRNVGTHQGGITEVAFSPSGSLLASASEDGTVWLWGVNP